MNNEHQADVLTKLIAACRGATGFAKRAGSGRAPEADAFLLGHLNATFPGVPIVAEGSDPATYRGFAAERSALFVVVAEGTVMLGLAEEGRATAGVILSGAADGFRTYGAADGLGAFLYADDGTRSPIHVSTTSDVAHVRCAVPRVRRTKSADAQLDSLGCAELVPVGDGGAELVRIAVGELDLHADTSQRSVQLWDTCAPDALVRAAGGTFTDGRGAPFYYRGSVGAGVGLLAANPSLHTEALRKYRQHDERTGGATMKG